MVIGSMRAITVDEVHDFVYWSDESDVKVKRATLDGSNKRDIYNITKVYGSK